MGSVSQFLVEYSEQLTTTAAQNINLFGTDLTNQMTLIRYGDGKTGETIRCKWPYTAASAFTAGAAIALGYFVWGYARHDVHCPSRSD